MLGWDVTDFGSKDFEHIGRTLFTLRNGNLHDSRYPKSYAEKLILDPEGQRAPAHFHRTKREDIINRGGGNICVQLTRVDAPMINLRKDRLATSRSMAVRRTIASGETVRLRPGESVCIPPRTIHQFWGEEGTGHRHRWYRLHREQRGLERVRRPEGQLLLRRPDTVSRGSQKTRLRVHYLCNEYPAAVAGSKA